MQFLVFLSEKRQCIEKVDYRFHEALRYSLNTIIDTIPRDVLNSVGGVLF